MRRQRFFLRESFDFLPEAYLDLYLPFNPDEMGRQNQKRPCLLILPGGGYGCVSQREGEPIGLHFLADGYNVFILHYSVAPVRFPAQLWQVAAALELIHKNADIWNCDKNHIAIMGFSAGGHLAAHYSTCYDCNAIREKFPESKPVQASILCYPVITADPAHAHRGSFENLLGYYPENRERDFFSCDRQVSDHTPPTFLWHTAADNLVPVMNSLLYAQALSHHNIPYELHIYSNGWHGLATVDDQTNDSLPAHFAPAKSWISQAKAWLRNTFAGQPE